MILQLSQILSGGEAAGLGGQTAPPATQATGARP